MKSAEELMKKNPDIMRELNMKETILKDKLAQFYEQTDLSAEERSNIGQEYGDQFFKLALEFSSANFYKESVACVNNAEELWERYLPDSQELTLIYDLLGFLAFKKANF
jgi:hypothetical protein